MYPQKSFRQSDPYYSETQDTIEDYDYRYSLGHKTYLTDIKPAIPYYQPDFEMVPNVPAYDPNDPANVPFVPVGNYEDEYKDYVVRYIRNLPKRTVNHEEVAFAKYLSECSILDLRIKLLQQLLKNDQRFNAKQLFDYFDSKKNSQIDFNEFQLGLQKLDIFLNNAECFGLFQRFGGHNDNQISSAEFKQMLTGPEDSSHFMRFGALKYMHHPLKQPVEQFLSVAQRDTISEILELQTQLERNLGFIREVIGEREILLALFRQIDIGSKGYLVVRDLVLYLNDFGGQFLDRDIDAGFRRISKNNCQRVNFNEFKTEFMKQENTNQLYRKQIRDKDYLQELRQKQQQQQQLQQQQEQQKQLAQKSVVNSQKKLKQNTQPLQKPYVQQPILQQKPQQVQNSELFGEEDLDELLFPGFQKYELQNTSD